MVELAAVDIGAFRFNAEYVFCVFLVGNADIDIPAQLSHGRTRFVACPQLAAVIQVTGNFNAFCFCRDAGLLADFNEIGTERGRDAGEVEPVRTVKNRVPVKIRGNGFLDCGMRTVIDTYGTALRRALFQIIDTDTVAAADDLRGIYAEIAQRVDCRLTDGMFRKLGHINGIHAVVCKGNRDIGFAAAEGCLHLVILEKTIIAVGC